MGKVAVAETKKRKKKGRPSLLDLKKRALEQQQEQQQQQLTTSSNPNFNTPKFRSTRRNPNAAGHSPSPEFIEPDDDDERKEKKVKLVVRLPQSNQHSLSQPRSSSLNSASCDSDSNADDAENQEESLSKRKINAVSDMSDDLVTDQGEKIVKATDTLHGSPLESGPTTPLPGKKLLVFILDRLQKKDTHGVFSEPVDPEELPDYYDIIEHPMDFGTVRKKLDNRVYSNLEQLEADVLLICSNAMQYNPQNTVFFRQARSIQELAKRDFENLRQEGEDGELQPKVVRRGRPPTKHLKKPLGGSPVERVGPELASGATLATGEDMSNAYNLRRASPLHRLQSTDASTNSHHRSRNGENYSELLSNWNDEFPASILKADMKYGNKQFSLDETRRDTYKEFHPTATGHEPCALYNLGGDMKQLMAVGLHSEHGYARSLARFAANLGPVVWKVASKKFSSVLPPGVKFGPPGLGVENTSTPISQSHLQRNGFKGGVFGYNNNNISSSQAGLEVASQIPPRMIPSRSDATTATTTAAAMPTLSAHKIHMDQEEAHLLESSSKTVDRGLDSSSTVLAELKQSGKSSMQLPSPHHNRQYAIGVPPDLNVRILGPGSPSSAGLRIGSPQQQQQQQQQQPDLALQL